MTDGLDFEETPAKDYKKKPKTGATNIKTVTPKKAKAINMSKDQFKKTKAAHKAEIQKLKFAIKKHKLLIKQAKIIYKLGKMKETK